MVPMLRVGAGSGGWVRLRRRGTSSSSGGWFRREACCGCNDSYLSDPAVSCSPGKVAVAEAHLDVGPISEGCVGAGEGMHLFGFRVGSARSPEEFDTRLQQYLDPLKRDPVPFRWRAVYSGNL